MTWETMTKAEQKEVSRLCSRHRDIRVNGSAALEKLAVREALQERRQAFVDLHGLKCFKCGGTHCEWVAGGKRNGGFWVLCQPCVRKPKL